MTETDDKKLTQVVNVERGTSRLHAIWGVQEEKLRPNVYGLWNDGLCVWMQLASGEILHSRDRRVIAASLANHRVHGAIDEAFRIAKIGPDGLPVDEQEAQS